MPPTNPQIPEQPPQDITPPTTYLPQQSTAPDAKIRQTKMIIIAVSIAVLLACIVSVVVIAVNFANKKQAVTTPSPTTAQEPSPAAPVPADDCANPAFSTSNAFIIERYLLTNSPEQLAKIVDVPAGSKVTEEFARGMATADLYIDDRTFTKTGEGEALIGGVTRRSAGEERDHYKIYLVAKDCEWKLSPTQGSVRIVSP